MTLEELYNNITSPSTAKWEVPVTIKRSNPLPLDSTGLFSSLEAAQNYAYTLSGATVEGVDPISYYSQIISVLDSTNNKVSLHVIVPPGTGNEADKTKYLQKIATLGDVYSKAEVDGKLSELPQYMIFRGTLGKEGEATISGLPAPELDSLGDTYKVITEGEYEYTLDDEKSTLTAKVGDTITCYKTAEGGYDWILIPSGDEEGTVDTWRSIVVNGEEYLGNNIETGNLNINTVEGNPVQVSTEDGLTFSHATIDSFTGLNASTPKYIKGVTVDGFGHITAVSVEDVKVYTSVEVVSESGSVKLEAATESDIIRFIQGTGVELVTFQDNIVPIGTPYYDDETLNNLAGYTESEFTAIYIDDHYSKIEGKGYIKTIKNGIQINHQDKPTSGDNVIPTDDQLITNINLDEFGHIASVTNISKGSFLHKILIGEESLELTSGEVTFEGDDKLNITFTETGLKFTHGQVEGRTAESDLTETGELITAVKVDATGHIGTVTRKSVTTNTVVTEGEKDKFQLKVGEQKLVEITELTTDVLKTGSSTLILDGNF